MYSFFREQQKYSDCSFLNVNISSSMTVNSMSLSCGRNKTFEDVTSGFGKHWPTFFTTFWHFIDQTTNWLIEKLKAAHAGFLPPSPVCVYPQADWMLSESHTSKPRCILNIDVFSCEIRVTNTYRLFTVKLHTQGAKITNNWHLREHHLYVCVWVHMLRRDSGFYCKPKLNGQATKRDGAHFALQKWWYMFNL